MYLGDTFLRIKTCTVCWYGFSICKQRELVVQSLVTSEEKDQEIVLITLIFGVGPVRNLSDRLNLYFSIKRNDRRRGHVIL